MIKKLHKIIERVKKDKKYEYIFLSIIVLLALLVRIYKLNNPIADWHSWRQADTASVTRIYVSQGINLLFPRYYDISTAQSGIYNPEGYRFVEFPVYNIAHTTFYSVFGKLDLEAWGRLTSAMFSIGSLFITYLLGKKYLGKWGGLLSALFFAIIPYNIYFSRVILPEPTATFFALGALWFFVLFIEKGKISKLYLSAVFFALALLTKPFTIFYSAPMFYMAYRKYGLKGMMKNRDLWLFGLISTAPLFAWRAWIQQYPEGIPFWSWAFNGDGIRFKPSFWRWIFGERLGKLILGIWGLIPFVFGILDYKKQKNFIHLFIVGMFLYVVVVATANVKHDYYQVFTIPAISLVLANGSLFLWKTKLFNKWAARVLLVFSLGLGLLMGWYQIREYYKINNYSIIEAGTAVNEILPKNALVIAPYNGDTAFLYQTERFGWPVIDRPLPELIEKGANYLVTVNLHDERMIKLQEEYEVIKKTDEYAIIDLTTKR